MRYIAAYLLLVLGGKAAPTAADIKAVLAAAGIQGDDARIAALLKEVEGKDLQALMKEGSAQLARFGGGGGGGGGAAPAAAAAPKGGAAPAAAAPAPKEETKEESGSMGLDLFG